MLLSLGASKSTLNVHFKIDIGVIVSFNDNTACGGINCLVCEAGFGGRSWCHLPVGALSILTWLDPVGALTVLNFSATKPLALS